MRIIIDGQSYGPPQLTGAMKAMYSSPNNRRYEPVELVEHETEGAS
jgi:hypothetical protein